MRFRVALLGLLCSLHPPRGLAGAEAARELYEQVNGLRVDPAFTYDLEPSQRIELRRADVQLSFERGKIAFFQQLNGHSTGVVFVGLGHVLASPRQPVE